MVEDFNMLFEYDSGYVVDGYKVPMGYELGSFEEFFYLYRQPQGEFVIVQKEVFSISYLITLVTLRHFVRIMIGMSFRISHSIHNLK